MSEIIERLALEPPRYGYMEEDLIGSARDCPACHGAGWFWMEDNVTTESVKRKCAFCEGKGQVVPHVFIKWLPKREERMKNVE